MHRWGGGPLTTTRLYYPICPQNLRFSPVLLRLIPFGEPSRTALQMRLVTAVRMPERFRGGCSFGSGSPVRICRFSRCHLSCPQTAPIVGFG